MGVLVYWRENDESWDIIRKESDVIIINGIINYFSRWYLFSFWFNSIFSGYKSFFWKRFRGFILFFEIFWIGLLVYLWWLIVINYFIGFFFVELFNWSICKRVF